MLVAPSLYILAYQHPQLAATSRRGIKAIEPPVD